MKKGWTYDKLGDICKLYQPHTISSKEMVDDGKYDVFGANGIIGKYNKYNHEEPEILMTCRGATCGNINVSTPKSWINGNAMVVHIKDEKTLNKSFLIYILSHIDKTHIITGAAQPQITRQTLSPLMIGYPTLSEQERIVERLDAAFAQIDELKSNAERQLAEARALFQSALKEMLEPKEGWEIMRLGEFAYMKAGNFVKASEIFSDYKEGLYPCYGGNGFRGYVKEPNQNGDYCMIGRQGALCGCINRAQGVFRTTEHAVIVKPYKEIPTSLVYYMLVRLNLNKYATGAAQPGLSVNHIAEAVIICVPPHEEQKRIADTLDSLKSKIDRLQEIFNNVSQECDALKQAMLRQIFE